MKPLKKAHFCSIGIFFGLFLFVLLTLLFDRVIRLIGLVGFFTALASYWYTLRFAVCPKCSVNFLHNSVNGLEGALNIMRLALRRNIACKKCGHTASKNDCH